MSAAYPILLDVEARRVVIVGGGAVAVRKAAGLVEAGAGDVVVVSPTFVDGFPAIVQKRVEAYRTEHLAGAALVFAATNSPAVNAAVVRDARERGVPVNRADAVEDNPGDFVTPARLREGPVMVTVSADSAALSAFIRDRLAERWDKRWTHMAAAMQALRPVVRGSGLPIARRRDIFRELATDAAMDVLDARGIEALKAWVMEKFPE